MGTRTGFHRTKGSILLVLVFCFVASGVAEAQQKPSAELEVEPLPEVKTSRLVLVDKAGKSRAVLEVNENDAVVLRLFDETGRARLALTANKDMSSLYLFDGSGDYDYTTALLSSKVGAGLFLDHKERLRVGISVDEKDGSSLRLYNKNGKSVFTAPRR